MASPQLVNPGGEPIVAVESGYTGSCAIIAWGSGWNTIRCWGSYSFPIDGGILGGAAIAPTMWNIPLFPPWQNVVAEFVSQVRGA